MRMPALFDHLEMFVTLAWCYDIVTICCISNSHSSLYCYCYCDFEFATYGCFACIPIELHRESTREMEREKKNRNVYPDIETVEFMVLLFSSLTLFSTLARSFDVHICKFGIDIKWRGKLLCTDTIGYKNVYGAIFSRFIFWLRMFITSI